jgi:hypothetical protein
VQKAGTNGRELCSEAVGTSGVGGSGAAVAVGMGDGDGGRVVGGTFAGVDTLTTVAGTALVLPQPTTVIVRITTIPPLRKSRRFILSSVSQYLFLWLSTHLAHHADDCRLVEPNRLMELIRDKPELTASLSGYFRLNLLLEIASFRRLRCRMQTEEKGLNPLPEITSF